MASVNKTRCALTICYLDEQKQLVKTLVQPAGTLLKRAIMASGILPTLHAQLEDFTYAIYGKKQPLNAVLHTGDRIELLRPVHPNAQKNARTLNPNLKKDQ